MPRAKPKSDVGRAMTRFNALRHGLTSTAPVIPGVESDDEWESHREAIVADLAPAGATESALAERIAALAWRLRRVERYESVAIAVGRERVDHDVALRQRRLGLPATVDQAQLLVEDAHRCLDIVEHLLDTPPATGLAAADAAAIMEALASSARADVATYVEGIDEAADGGGWTVGRLVAVMEALAARDGEAFVDVLAAAVARARTVAGDTRLSLVRLDEEIDRLRRERLLPDAPTLDRIMRHEANLNRMFYQALNQLEAAQSRRCGAPTPLHRIQAYGLPGG
jgi:hypothetical protein